jgi:membrane protease YdiL (CAAX protease family)
MSTLSLSLFYAAVAILLAGILLPGWDTARAPKRAVKRRIYWTATIVGAIVAFIAGLPDLQSSIAFVAMCFVLMVGLAYFRTPNIKINGQIWAAYPPNREPDPAPPID